MNFVSSIKLLDLEAKEIPSMTGSGAPTETTQGAVGCLYMNTDNGDLYKCVAFTDGKYRWANVETGQKVDLSGYVTTEEFETSIGDIETALDELHNYAQNLISGGGDS